MNSKKFKIILVDSLWASFIAAVILLIPTVEEMVVDFNELISKIGNYNRYYDILLVGLWVALLLSWGFKIYAIKKPTFRATSIFFFYFITGMTFLLGIVSRFLVSIVLTGAAIISVMIVYCLAGFLSKTMNIHKK